MRNILLSGILLFLTNVAFAQSDEGSSDEVENIWRKKTAFVLGGGPGIFWGRVYDQPFADRIDGNVHISKLGAANKIMANLSLGISYTFFTKKFYSYDPVVVDGAVSSIQKVEDKPHGISAILLFNPLSLNNNSFNSSTSVNLGIGLGKKWGGGFAIYGVMDFVGIRQPRSSFVEVYGNTKQPYKINGDIQYSFDTNDEAIFKTRFYPVLALRLVYSIDVFNSFKAISRTIENQQAENRAQQLRQEEEKKKQEEEKKNKK